MLARGQEMNTLNGPVRVDWQNEEWTLIADELKRLYPSRSNLAYYRFAYSTIEIEDAAEAVLPQHRHRAIESFESVKRPLFEAFQRMLPTSKPLLCVVPETVRTDGHIVWKPEEWEAVASEIYTLDNDAFNNSGAKIGMKIVLQAQQILAVNRRRNFKQVVGFRSQILKTWEHMQAAKHDAPEPVIVDFPSGPIMEPTKKRNDDNNALATAMHDAFKAVPENDKKRKQRVDWTPAEWLDIAREMRRQNPHVNFFASKFHIIDLPAIRDAQREVLELNRRRTLMGTKGLQEPLVKAFAALLEEVNRENSAPPVAEVVAEPVAEMGTEVGVKGIAAVAARPVSSFLAPETIAGNTLNAALLNAAAPLLNLLVSELATRLAPSLVQMMLPELLKALNTAPAPVLTPYSAFQAPLNDAPVARATLPVAIEPAAPAIGEKVPEVAPRRPTAAEIAAYNGVTTTKEKKQRIVLLGPMGKQITDLKQAYPHYDLVFIEHGHGVKEAATDCGLFIVYTSHFNAANKASVNKYVPREKLRQVAGSLSSVKNQIQVWEVSNQRQAH